MENDLENKCLDPWQGPKGVLCGSCGSHTTINTVLPLVGGQGELYPTRNFGVQLTLLQPGGGADYAHHITASPPGFENPAASLFLHKKVPKMLRRVFLLIKSGIFRNNETTSKKVDGRSKNLELSKNTIK